MPNTLTRLGLAFKRAESTGKPHIWWDGTHWNAVTPDGGSGHLAPTPAKALEWARGAREHLRQIQRFGEELLRRERVERSGPRPRLMFGDRQRALNERVWLASDPDAPRPNTRIVC